VKKMQAEQIINPWVFDPSTLQAYSKNFHSTKPVRHVIIDNFLVPGVAEEIAQHFPALDSMKKHYHGINERKAETSDFVNMHRTIQQLPVHLSSKQFLDWLEALTQISALESIHDRLGYGLHQGGNNSFLDVHIDYNIHPVHQLQRKLNLILFFNHNWQAKWGGQLELWDSHVQNCVQSIDPIFNRCVIFECSEISYHGYSKISVPDSITRKSYYQYFFAPIDSGLAYHDTIFKSRPTEIASKKILTGFKEFSKNTVKKILYYAGLKRFLK
jgi:hypothetical protein